jgi:hypothetical protein
VFFLRRPRGQTAHVWRAVRTKEEGRAFVTEHLVDEPEARRWADTLPGESFDDLIRRYAVGG